MGFVKFHNSTYPDLEHLIEEEIVRAKTSSKLASDVATLAYRPMRSSDLLVTLTADTRIYHTVMGVAYNFLVGATAGIRVPAGQAWLFLGWMAISDVNTPMGVGAVGRIRISETMKQECSLSLVEVQENHMMLCLEQFCFARENELVEIQVKDPTGLGVALGMVFPIAIVIGDYSAIIST